MRVTHLLFILPLLGTVAVAQSPSSEWPVGLFLNRSELDHYLRPGSTGEFFYPTANRFLQAPQVKMLLETLYPGQVMSEGDKQTLNERARAFVEYQNLVDLLVARILELSKIKVEILLQLPLEQRADLMPIVHAGTATPMRAVLASLLGNETDPRLQGFDTEWERLSNSYRTENNNERNLQPPLPPHFVSAWQRLKDFERVRSYLETKIALIKGYLPDQREKAIEAKHTFDRMNWEIARHTMWAGANKQIKPFQSLDDVRGFALHTLAPSGTHKDPAFDFARLMVVATADETTKKVIAHALDSQLALTDLEQLYPIDPARQEDVGRLLERLPFLEHAAQQKRAAQSLVAGSLHSQRNEATSLLQREELYFPVDPKNRELFLLVASAPALPEITGFKPADWWMSFYSSSLRKTWRGEIVRRLHARLRSYEQTHDSVGKLFSLIQYDTWAKRSDDQRGNAAVEYSAYIAAIGESLKVIDEELTELVDRVVDWDRASHRFVFNNEAIELVQYRGAARAAFDARPHRIAVGTYFAMVEKKRLQDIDTEGDRQNRAALVSGVAALLCAPVGSMGSLRMLTGSTVALMGGGVETAHLWELEAIAQKLNHDNPFGEATMNREIADRLQSSLIWSGVFLGFDVATFGFSAVKVAQDLRLASADFRLADNVSSAASTSWTRAAVDTLRKLPGRALEAIVVRSETVQRLLAENRFLYRLAYQDLLSGVFNRNALEIFGNKVLAQARPGKPVGALLLDGDSFKAFNDILGYNVGDQVIQLYGSHARAALGSTGTIAEAIREGDWIFRMGGEEFLVLLPDTTLEGATVVAKRLRDMVAADPERLAFSAQIRNTADPVKLAQACRIPVGSDPGHLGTVSISVTALETQTTVELLKEKLEVGLKRIKILTETVNGKVLPMKNRIVVDGKILD